MNEKYLIYGHWRGEIHDDMGIDWGVARRQGEQWHLTLSEGYSVWCDSPMAIIPLPGTPEKKDEEPKP
jgi:hypothetical protein